MSRTLSCPSVSPLPGSTVALVAGLGCLCGPWRIDLRCSSLRRVGLQTERLDEQKLEILRVWGAGLSGDEREEVRAAGKAIVLLIDEIEQLHVDVWSAKVRDPKSVATAPPTRTSDDHPNDIEATLWTRLSTYVPRLRRE